MKRYFVAELHGYGREVHPISRIFFDYNEAVDFLRKCHHHFEIEIFIFETHDDAADIKEVGEQPTTAPASH